MSSRFVTTSHPPQRVQRKRTKGSRLPAGAVCVSRGTKWGNPFSWKSDAAAWLSVSLGERADDRKALKSSAVVLYIAWIDGKLEALPVLVRSALPADLPDPPTKDAIRGELRGKSLACWCAPDEVCHAQYLMEIANKAEGTT